MVGKARPIKPERDAANGRTQAITISEEVRLALFQHSSMPLISKVLVSDSIFGRDRVSVRGHRTFVMKGKVLVSISLRPH